MDWQPIETAPKDWVPILVWAISESEREDADDDEREPERSVMVAAHSSIQRGTWWLHGTMHCVYQPTHWMPLPPPPYATKADSDNRTFANPAKKCGDPACILYGRCMAGNCQLRARKTVAVSDGDDGA